MFCRHARGARRAPRAILAALAPFAAAGALAAPPAPIQLDVDLSDTGHKVFTVHETIPARPGPLVLFYPKWIPGEHGPTGTLEGVTGLSVRAGGRILAWRRDREDMYALHLQVPDDADAVELSFQFLSPGPGRGFGGGVSATPSLTVLEWNQVVFYPAGDPARELTVRASVALPAQWGWASALEAAGDGAAGRLHFDPVSLETLVDSPLAAGRNFRRIELAPGAAPVNLDLFADRAENLAAAPEQLAAYRRLVAEAQALFGARHYRHYDFLFVLSDATEHFGLEHHQSSDDRYAADYFTDPDAYLAGSGLLSHEYVHSWNGKFRRPAGLVTRDFNRDAMKGDLLWVYEGLTEYWGEVLAARAGLRTPEQFRDGIALLAAQMVFTPGRAWRPLQDTADEAQVLYEAPRAWSSWRRGVDFYPEGLLLWLDVDTRLREASRGKRSLDDFARRFFGRDDGAIGPLGYDMDDVAAALDEVVPGDWKRWLRTRLDAMSTQAPLDGIERGGWRLAYTAEPSALFKASEKMHHAVNLAASLGVTIGDEEPAGTLLDVVWNGPAFAAGLAPGMRLVAVNGTRYAPGVLKDAVKAAAASAAPIELLVEDFDRFRSVRVDYHGGLRYPRLERVEDAPDRIGAIGAALSGAARGGE